MNWVHTTRVAILGTVSLFSFIVLILAAHWLSVTSAHLQLRYEYASLAAATAFFTSSLPVMLIVDVFRRGAITSMILVESCWLSFLWVMWLATAAVSVHSIGQLFSGGCNNEFVPHWWNVGCSETKAIVAFSFLNWIALTVYMVLLLTMCVFAANKGGPIWKTSVKEANFTPSMNLHIAGPTSGLSTPDQKPRQSYPPPQPDHLNHV